MSSVQLGFKVQDIITDGRLTNDDIKQIKIWVSQQEHLPVISDEEIVNFLLSNDKDQEGTKATVNAFFKIRNEAPDIFNNRIMSEENCAAMQSVAYYGIAPKRTEDNCAVILTQLYNTNYKSLNLVQYYKFLYITLEAAMYSNPPSGLILVIDLIGGGLMHLTKLRVGAISLSFRYLQEALPLKLKNIHIVNAPYFMDKALAIMKPFMNDQVKKMITFHKRGCNMDQFYEKYVAKELLSKDLGGELPCMKNLTEQLIENLKDMEPYFTAEESRRSVLKSSQS